MRVRYVNRNFEFLSSALLWIIIYFGRVSGQFDANFTLQNVWGRLQPDFRSLIECFDDNYKLIRISRKLDTGQGARLPRHSQQFYARQPGERIIFMPAEDELSRFGAFQCKISNGNVTTEIVTLKLPPFDQAELDAVNPYTVVNVGDSLELEINVSKKLHLPIKWRHNGVEVPEWDDKTIVEIEEVKITDAGIYESYYEGRQNLGVHALMRVIVRNCPFNMYGKDCDQECPPCYNGGVCHDTWGVCVCPPGFTGLDCGIACGGNRFGAECSKVCSSSESNNTDELCSSFIFCKPDPYGCSCAPGFKGVSCTEHCDPGWYGADCKQPCHCADGENSCNRITGSCNDDLEGWRESSGQTEDTDAGDNMETTTVAHCPLGWYGPNCEHECHCAGNKPCDGVTGLCPPCCDAGWTGPSCNLQVLEGVGP